MRACIRVGPFVIARSSPMNITKSNTLAVEHYAQLVDLSPEEFLNRFLKEFLVKRFSDPDSGEAEPFLLSFTFKNRAKAERLASWVKERLTFPNSRNTLEVEVLELPQGNFKVRAAWIGDGRTDVISC